MTTYHSLWLTPSGQLNHELRDLILRLSQSYAGPAFPPHMTLLGQLEGSEAEIKAKSQALAAQVKPFQVHLTQLDYLDEYFRCVFVRGEETSALLEANRKARAVFQREEDPPFMPHLSLLYGDYDAATKIQVIASIGREFNRSFPVNEIQLVSTTGEPKDWVLVQSFPLQDR